LPIGDVERIEFVEISNVKISVIVIRVMEITFAEMAIVLVFVVQSTVQTDIDAKEGTALKITNV
jgi:hypothetical protein